MNLATEAERLEAFYRVYGNNHRFIQDQFSGPHRAGFELITFDTDSLYAQWSSRGNNPESSAYREFATNRSLNIPVQRRRSYFSQDSIRQTAEISYPQGNEIIEWYVAFDEVSPILFRTKSQLTIYASRTLEEVPLVKCFYNSIGIGKIPNIIHIAKGSFEETIAAHQTASRWEKHYIPHALTLKKREGDVDRVIDIQDDHASKKMLGSIHLGETFKDNGLSIAIDLPSNFNFTLFVENKMKNYQLSLDAPIIGYAKLCQAISDGWWEFASIPRRYPLDFQFQQLPEKRSRGFGAFFGKLLSLAKAQ